MNSELNAYQHETVMLRPAVEALLGVSLGEIESENVQTETAFAHESAKGTFVDATFGRGGHSRLIWQHLSQGILIGCDRDPEAATSAEAFAATPDVSTSDAKQFIFLKQNISQLAAEDALAQIMPAQQDQSEPAVLDGLLMDLGISSPQIDNADRGFSFSKDGPLDMRMDNTQGITASDVVNQTPESDLADIFYQYGDEKRSRRIAKTIVEQRVDAPFTTTKQLATCIADVLGWKEKAQHPATRCFQALRIYVNQELDELRAGLEAAVKLVKRGGRLVVISFHSLEDRLVKQFFNPPKVEALPGIPLEAEQVAQPFKQLGKAIKPSKQEIAQNPRSRSAIMRIGVRQ